MRDVDIFKTENNLMSFFIKDYNYTLFSSSLEFNCIKPNSGKNSMVLPVNITRGQLYILIIPMPI